MSFANFLPPVNAVLWPADAVAWAAGCDCFVNGGYFFDPEGRQQAKATHAKFFLRGRARRAAIVAHIVGGMVESVAGGAALYGWACAREPGWVLRAVAPAAVADAVEGSLLAPLHDPATVYWLGVVSLLAALFLHIPSGAALVPSVWGIPYITKMGYAGVALLRFLVAAQAMTLLWAVESPAALMTTARRAGLSPHVSAAPLSDAVLWTQHSWTLLQIAYVVRVVSRYCLPTTTVGAARAGRRGDLLTDKTVYTNSVSIAVVVTLPFVFPPWINVVVLAATAVSRALFPPQVVASAKFAEDTPEAVAAPPTRAPGRGRSATPLKKRR